MTHDLINFFQLNSISFFLIIGFISLCIGSFLNVVIYRLPIMINNAWRKDCHEFLEITSEANEDKTPEPFNLAIPRSSCPSCKNTIRAWQNIPIISYLLLKGRCAYCKNAISLRYPFIELSTAILSILV